MLDELSEIPDHERMHRQPTFDRFATLAARWMGHGLTFGVAVLVTLGWALSGPIFHFSNAWQLIINTTTTVLTFLMVFLIQNTLNRDSAAIHVKLDELVRVTEQARDQLIGVENLGDEDLQRLRQAEQDGAGTVANDRSSR
jgi:low affinity Fe/Cu permease